MISMKQDRSAKEACEGLGNYWTMKGLQGYG